MKGSDGVASVPLRATGCEGIERERESASRPGEGTRDRRAASCSVPQGEAECRPSLRKGRTGRARAVLAKGSARGGGADPPGRTQQGRFGGGLVGDGSHVAKSDAASSWYRRAFGSGSGTCKGAASAMTNRSSRDSGVSESPSPGPEARKLACCVKWQRGHGFSPETISPTRARSEPSRSGPMRSRSINAQAPAWRIGRRIPETERAAQRARVLKAMDAIGAWKNLENPGRVKRKPLQSRMTRTCPATAEARPL